VLLAAGLVLDGAVSSPWQLSLSYGLLTAVGVAAAGWVPAVLLVRGWYPQRVGTMLGLTSAGIGVGISVFVPLCQWLIDLVGWHPGAPPRERGGTTPALFGWPATWGNLLGNRRRVAALP
jgi:hypothetical protein